jgi:predicted transcriptional regulator
MISNTKEQNYDKIIEAPRTCVSWTIKENYDLIIQIKDGLKLEDIAKNNQRTILAVKYHIITNAFNIIKESNITIDEISKLVNMPIYNLKKYIKNQEREKKNYI